MWERLINGEVDMLVHYHHRDGRDVPASTPNRRGCRPPRAGLSSIRYAAGRRSARRHAYFTYRRGKVLTEDATSACRPSGVPGSVRVKACPARPEIRGAGDILGPQQHGICRQWADMYLKPSTRPCASKGEKRPERCVMDLSVEAACRRIISKAGFCASRRTRIASIESEEDAQGVTDELIDHFGEPPGQVTALIDIARASLAPPAA